MVERTWLYLYENTKAKKIYIGIGKSMERVFERHNRQAEDLRDSSGTLSRFHRGEMLSWQKQLQSTLLP